MASTDVRWIGEAEKCFRFEILGCHPESVTPEIHFEAESKALGYIEANWSQPQLTISNNEVVILPTQHYLINVDDQSINVSDNRLIMPRPLWGKIYSFNVECLHENLNNLNCGQFQVKAIINGATQDCLENMPPCPIEKRVQFMKPETITAMTLKNGSVFVEWKDSSMGWKTSQRRVKVIDENAKVLVTSLSNDNQLTVNNLQKDQSYQLIFSPEGPNIPNFIQEFSTTLALCKDMQFLNN